MIGGIVNRLIDVREANLSAETWERNFNRQLQENAELLGRIRRLEKERAADRAIIADFRSAADGDTRRLVAENTQLRKDKVTLFEQAKLSADKCNQAIVARRVAESALSALKTPPAGDAAKREAEQHRANAQRLTDELTAMRQKVEDFEAEIAELRAQLEKRSTPDERS